MSKFSLRSSCLLSKHCKTHSYGVIGLFSFTWCKTECLIRAFNVTKDRAEKVFEPKRK